MGQRILGQAVSAGFISQYGVSLLNGAVTFMTLSWLSHLLPSASTYSEISGILSLYIVYAVFLDLGSGAEYFRRSAKKTADSSPFAALLATRLLFALLILPVGFIHTRVAELDWQGSTAVMLLLASLIPAAVLSSVDTMLLAQGKNASAITAKILRVTGTLSLPVVVSCTRTESLPVLFLIYFVVTMLFAILLSWWVFRRYQSSFSTVTWEGWLPATKAFLRDLSKPGLAAIIVVIAATLFNMSLFKDVGIHNLATYVVVNSLFSPITTAAQTLNTLSLRRLAEAMGGPAATRHELLRTTRMHLLIFFAGGVGLALAKMVGFVDLFFKHLDETFLPLLALGIGAQVFAAAAVPFAFVLQIHTRRRLFFFCQVIPFCAGGVALFVLSHLYGLWGNVSAFLGIQLWMFVSLAWAVKHRLLPDLDTTQPT